MRCDEGEFTTIYWNNSAAKKAQSIDLATV